MYEMIKVEREDRVTWITLKPAREVPRPSYKRPE
jgi:hypothetical protein